MGLFVCFGGKVVHNAALTSSNKHHNTVLHNCSTKALFFSRLSEKTEYRQFQQIFLCEEWISSNKNGTQGKSWWLPTSQIGWSQHDLVCDTATSTTFWQFKGIKHKEWQVSHQNDKGEQNFSFEGLTTFAPDWFSVEFSPIYQTSEEPSDSTTLMPAHLCLGGKLEILPLIESNDSSTAKTISIKKWSQVQNLLIKSWKNWSKENVSFLQERAYCKQERANFKVKDVVFVFDNNDSPLQWWNAKNTHLYGGLHQFVRVVKLKSATGINKLPYKNWYISLMLKMLLKSKLLLIKQFKS